MNGKAPSKIASLGLGRTFQNIRLFKNMTVLENVLIGLGNHGKSEVFASFFRLPAFYKNEEALKTKAIELLKIFDLDGDADTLAKTFLTVNNDVWKSFVPLRLNQKFFSWMSQRLV